MRRTRRRPRLRWSWRCSGRRKSARERVFQQCFFTDHISPRYYAGARKGVLQTPPHQNKSSGHFLRAVRAPSIVASIHNRFDDREKLQIDHKADKPCADSLVQHLPARQNACQTQTEAAWSLRRHAHHVNSAFSFGTTPDAHASALPLLSGIAVTRPKK